MTNKAKPERNAELYARHKKGWRVKELAAEYWIPSSRVSAIVAKLERIEKRRAEKERT